jgi:hypothetical protein
VECLVLRGLAGCQAYFDELLKYIFTYLQNVIGNLSAMIHVPCVASKQGTPTIEQTTTMKQSFPLPSRAELDSAFVAIYRSDMPHIHKQTLLVLMERAKREADRKLAKLSK